MTHGSTRRRFIQATAATVGGIALPELAGATFIPILGRGPKIAAIDYRTDNTTFNDPEVVKLHARYDYSLLGMLPSQSTAAGRQFCINLKQANPNIRIGQYTILSQMYDSGGTFQLLWEAIDAGDGKGHDWWARAAASSTVDAGGKVKPSGYEMYSAWSVNQTSYAPADAAGRRWPEKCADGYYTLTLQGLWQADVLDFVFNDNVWWHPYPESNGLQPATNLPGGACADYKLAGANNSPTDSALGVAWRRGYVNYWNALKAKMPGLHICANADNDRSTYDSSLSTPELVGQADYAFIEALSGKGWSVATFSTMDNVMKRYRSQLQSVKTTVFVNTYVDSGNDSLGRTLQKARFGLGLSMLGDGHACIADTPFGKTMYPYWFDELEAPIGHASEPMPTAALANGLWMRRYLNGCVVVNPVDNGGRWMGGSVALARSGNTVTLTRTAGVPDKAPGDKVRIQDCNDPSFNGVFALTQRTATTLKWTQVGPDASWAPSQVRGFLETLGTLDLSTQGYKRILGRQDSHDNYIDGGTSQNDGTAVGVLTLWSNDAILLLRG